MILIPTWYPLQASTIALAASRARSSAGPRGTGPSGGRGGIGPGGNGSPSNGRPLSPGNPLPVGVGAALAPTQAMMRAELTMRLFILIPGGGRQLLEIHGQLQAGIALGVARGLADHGV